MSDLNGKPGEGRKMWRFGKKKKALKPVGKVPPGVKGLTKSIGGELASERSHKWDQEEARNVSGWVNRSPAWAISIALHFVAAVILMNVVYFTQHGRIGQVFRMTLRSAAPGGAKQGDQDNGVNGKDNEDSKPAGPEKKDETPPVAEQKPANIKPALPTPGQTATPFPLKVLNGEVSGKDGPGGIYAGRGGAGRGEMLRQFGGDGQSEQAVIDGLAWLAKHQSKSGAWDPEKYADNCPRAQSCGDDNRGEPAYAGAVTGLAILAYLGAGYSHLDDHLRPQDEGGPVTHEYTQTIKKALQYVCREQDEKTGLIDPEGERNMYVHGIASLALVEAYSMTKDPGLRPHAQRAVIAIVDSQQDSGGWNYTPDAMNRSDTSITSWMVMTLRSARTAGLAVPKRTWDRSRFFMSKVTDYTTGNVGYCLQNGRVTRGCNSMTAIGMATRAYLGMPDDQQISDKFVDTILKSPPRYDDTPGACPNWGGLQARKGSTHWSLYYTYYATLALFHHGGKAWEEWNSKMRAVTLPAQRKEGHGKGSWDPVVWDGAWGGRVYTTAFNVMNLEVYYRYLPCYQVGAEFGLSKLVTDDEWDKVVADARRGKYGEVKGSADDTPADAKGTKPPDDRKPEVPKGGATAEELIKELGSDDMMTRRNASKELCTRHELAAVDALIQAAKVEKTSARPLLVEYLGAFGDSDKVLDFLVEMLTAGEDRLQNAAFTALRKATGETSIGRDAKEWRVFLQKQKDEKVKK